jgi:hypothetical protein
MDHCASQLPDATFPPLLPAYMSVNARMYSYSRAYVSNILTPFSPVSHITILSFVRSQILVKA